MSEFHEFLQHNATGNFGQDFNEHIILIYKILRRAVSAQCDILILTRTEFAWFRNNQKMGSFRLEDFFMPVLGWGGTLDLVIGRDNIVRDHVRMISSDQDNIVYSIS